MTIGVSYHDQAQEIAFSGSDKSELASVISNLKKSHIAFRDLGALVRVNADHFSSRMEMQEKVLEGFSEIKDLDSSKKQEQNAAMTFGYVSMVPSTSQDRLQALQKKMKAATSPGERTDYHNLTHGLRESSSKLLDEFFNQKKAPRPV